MFDGQPGTARARAPASRMTCVLFPRDACGLSRFFRVVKVTENARSSNDYHEFWLRRAQRSGSSAEQAREAMAEGVKASAVTRKELGEVVAPRTCGRSYQLRSGLLTIEHLIKLLGTAGDAQDFTQKPRHDDPTPRTREHTAALGERHGGYMRLLDMLSKNDHPERPF
ncbi:hypothetical protein D9757_011106 [Collybiopsis confluens]|uniref:Uncharacterized protein n=1 Tax=Collybiopsis confluens TaxID=2823264 RepID=A0A8H5LWP2_9AGAR|nr:hypothetical protein D9757_011106 [Collybiopsis confluens]